MQRISASITAALPKSLARFDKPWISNDIRSMAASTLEFNSSTINTKNTLAISNTFSTGVQGRNRAVGINKTARANSCLKALSSSNAYFRPFQELMDALIARVIPLLPL